MRRSARFASLAGTASALAVALVMLHPNAPTAAAATGTFTYTDAAGVTRTSANPPDGSCIVLAGAGKVANDTSTPVGFYRTGNCQEKVANVAKGDAGSVPMYGSVMFGGQPQPAAKPQSRQRQQPPESKPTLPLGGLLGG
ncbi:MAG TPA: hypothetical protein VGM60_08260 [Pseudonocardia sp.]|jgi:hypothetical protein|uniref:hypothetical protein n=1 Tax=Pseudonocardia sp. TaxID=60912 RepID=UPI002F42EE7B